MGRPDARRAELVLCLADGTVLGSTPSFAVTSPWAPEVAPVCDAATVLLGERPTILRILEFVARPDGQPDLTRYLAEIPRPPAAALRPVTGDPLAPVPHRMPWASVGGPAALLGWAAQALAVQGIELTGEAAQQRTWNLSTLWRLPTTQGTVWLKAVPPFFAHEGALLERLARHAVPRVLARSPGAVLLAEIPGDDLYDHEPAQARAMVDLLVDIQRDQRSYLAELFRLGLPDWRMPALRDAVTPVFERYADALPASDRAAVASVLAGWDGRTADLDACGLSDMLVHGDFHPGNVRGSGGELVLLDWGDSGIGHPLLDEAAFTERMPRPEADAVRAHWADVWARTVPGSDATRAMTLLSPIAALRQAAVYQGFLDRVEPDERFYHRDDPVRWLERAAAVAA
ncbi:hypothetical protein ASD65_04760 [Microbacterium sp. Root61]|uniref:phosphotransferase family protein n=1 Tax=Microbacterium sp. Root61 TaxID=1736570 RepID=UPI0006F74141|nr:phosphotransferase [Microbacterium sp. Root61]KRA23808.1 hypothetical protein ASD65_04760 [Microbacterium sp. Root61]